MKRRIFATSLMVVLAMALVLTAAACSSGTTTNPSPAPTSGTSSGGTSSTGGTTITEQNFAFSPATATVKVGDTVTFTNSDSVAHNVKIDGQELGVQNPGESKTWTASKAGSFPYSCVIHPAMTGEITVQ